MVGAGFMLLAVANSVRAHARGFCDERSVVSRKGTSLTLCFAQENQRNFELEKPGAEERWPAIGNWCLPWIAEGGHSLNGYIPLLKRPLKRNHQNLVGI